ncbi:DEAD-box ATP-dependent RNA helicase CshA [compost metagenome]
MEAGELGEYKGMAIQLLEQYDSVNLLAAAFKLITGEKNDKANIELTPEEPIRVKRRNPDIRSSGRKPSGYGNRGGGSGSGGGGYRRDNREGGNRGGYGNKGGYNKEGGRDRDSYRSSSSSSDRKPRSNYNGDRRPAKRNDNNSFDN